MLERVCRMCQAGNSLESAVCAACGAALEAPLAQRESAPLARRESLSLAQRVRNLPILRSPAARSVALGLTALALDVGASLLRQRHRDEPASPATTPQSTTLAQSARRAFMRQRVWEEFNDDGSVRRRVVENLIIRDDH